MYEELPYKYKYMINKIVNCIIQYIMRNLKNNLLIETKLILIFAAKYIKIYFLYLNN